MDKIDWDEIVQTPQLFISEKIIFRIWLANIEDLYKQYPTVFLNPSKNIVELLENWQDYHKSLEEWRAQEIERVFSFVQDGNDLKELKIKIRNLRSLGMYEDLLRKQIYRDFKAIVSKANLLQKKHFMMGVFIPREPSDYRMQNGLTWRDLYNVSICLIKEADPSLKWRETAHIVLTLSYLSYVKVSTKQIDKIKSTYKYYKKKQKPIKRITSQLI